MPETVKMDISPFKDDLTDAIVRLGCLQSMKKGDVISEEQEGAITASSHVLKSIFLAMQELENTEAKQ